MVTMKIYNHSGAYLYKATDATLNHYHLDLDSKSTIKMFYQELILFSILSITIGIPLDFGQELNFELLKKFDSPRLQELGQRSLRLLTNSDRVRDSLNENDISEELVDDRSNLSFGLDGSENLSSLDLITVKNTGDDETMSDLDLPEGNNNSESVELENVRIEFDDDDSVEGSGAEMFDEVVA